MIIFSFSRMRKMPHRMKKVSCLARASFRRRRLPSLGGGTDAQTQSEQRPGRECVETPLVLSQHEDVCADFTFYEVSNGKGKILYLTALVTSANCMRWYFLRSSMVGM